MTKPLFTRLASSVAPLFAATGLAFGLISWPGCTRSEPPRMDAEQLQREADKAHSQVASDREAGQVAKGKSVYLSSCIACHNTNPQKAGALGPEVWGSSRELLEARIMTATYPPGYNPKRPSHAMQPLPHLQGEIDALHAYLNSARP